MRQTTIIAAMLAVFMVLAASGTGWDQVFRMQSCTNVPDDPNENIVNCTALIQSGQLSDEILAWVHLIRGNSYRAICDDRRAIEDFDEAVRLDPPDVAYAYYSRAYTQADLNEYDRAVSDWEKAIQLWGMEYSVVLRVKGVQEDLKKDGYYAGPIDGIIGPGTRRGLISRFKARPERDCAVNQN